MTHEQLILDLHRRRSGFGQVPAGTPTLRSPVCGDEITLQAQTVAGVIRSIAWTGHGCTVSLASASALAELAAGLPVDEFVALRQRFEAAVLSRDQPVGDAVPVDPVLGDAVAFAGIGRLPLRAGCATLAWRAVTDALLRGPSAAP